MFQFDCPGCGTPIYSKKPKEAGGFRCLMCGFSATPSESGVPKGSQPPEPPSAPASAAPPPPPVEAPPLPEEWELIDLLGKGGMGQVWRARHRLTDEVVAIKCLIGDHVEEPQYTQRFAREVQVLHRLTHPHVTGLRHSGIFQKRPWLAMELVRGATLRERMVDGPMRPRDAVEFAFQIAQALEYTHSNGVVHRDLKPENVLVDATAGAKVTDFGLAGLHGPNTAQRLTSLGMVMGTLEYMAPEQMTDTSTAGPPADLYSLGVMFFEMLTGRKPHGQEMPSSIISGLPRTLDALTVNLLDRNAARRPKAEQAVQALGAALAQLGGTPAPVSAAAAKAASIGPAPIMFAEPSAASRIQEPAATPSAQPSSATILSKGPTPAPAPTASVEPPAFSPGAPAPSAGPTGVAASGPMAWVMSHSVAVGVAAVVLLAVVAMVVFHDRDKSSPPSPPAIPATPGTEDPDKLANRQGAGASGDTGSVFVGSEPAGAHILDRNRKDTGKCTPFTFEGLPAGEFYFVVKSDGYKESKCIGDVKPGKTVRYAPILERGKD